MDEANRSSKSTSQEESNIASRSSAKPLKRRRLAHRRQYARSRRIASSYLRSQFVRYETSGEYQPGPDLADGWTRTRTLEGDRFGRDWVTFETDIVQQPAWRSELLHPGPKDASLACWSQQQVATSWTGKPGRAVPEGYLTSYSSSSLDSYTLDATSSVPSVACLDSPPPSHSGSTQLRFRSANQPEKVNFYSRPGSPRFLYQHAQSGSRKPASSALHLTESAISSQFEVQVDAGDVSANLDSFTTFHTFLLFYFSTIF